MVKKSSASSQQGKQLRLKQKNIIITDNMQKELNALKNRKINLSGKDSAEITDWSQAEVGKFYRPTKEQITVRIDSDVLWWFKHAADKYQTLINKACREYMVLHKKSEKNTKRKRA